MADTVNGTDIPQPPIRKHHIDITHVFLDGFLAFLLFLLVIACTIVLRSFVVHRRSRAQLRDALEAGLVLDHRGNLVPGPKKASIGEKPMIWEVWVDEHGDMDDHGDLGDNKLDQEKGLTKPWAAILPISARTMAPDELHGSDPTKSGLHDQNLTQLPTSRRSQESVSSTSSHSQQLEVSVLISMPTPHRRQDAKGGAIFRDSMEDNEIPEVVFGVTNVVVNA